MRAGKKLIYVLHAVVYTVCSVAMYTFIWLDLSFFVGLLMMLKSCTDGDWAWYSVQVKIDGSYQGSVSNPYVFENGNGYMDWSYVRREGSDDDYTISHSIDPIDIYYATLVGEDVLIVYKEKDKAGQTFSIRVLQENIVDNAVSFSKTLFEASSETDVQVFCLASGYAIVIDNRQVNACRKDFTVARQFEAALGQAVCAVDDSLVWFRDKTVYSLDIFDGEKQRTEYQVSFAIQTLVVSQENGVGVIGAEKKRVLPFVLFCSKSGKILSERKIDVLFSYMEIYPIAAAKGQLYFFVSDGPSEARRRFGIQRTALAGGDSQVNPISVEGSGFTGRVNFCTAKSAGDKIYVASDGGLSVLSLKDVDAAPYDKSQTYDPDRFFNPIVKINVKPQRGGGSFL